jgi:crotonobetainyl-CoA:carnitine CoA-transferase CaiB-like acyl-CoA transferase
VASPLRFSQTPVAYSRAAPTLGEHTDAVLAEKLGLDAARIAALRAKGVV